MEIIDATTISNTTKPENTAPVMPPRDQLVPARARGKRRILWLLGALLVIGAGVFGYHWAFGKAKVHYITAVVTRGDIASTVVEEGVVQPVKYVDVGAQTSGMLQLLKVKQGDHVVKHQLLAEIDPVLANTALTAANAALASITSQRAAEQAQLVLANVQYVRDEDLLVKGFISASARDVTRAAYHAAIDDVSSLSDQMKQATATVNTAKANLGYTNIFAPMAGDIVSISLLQGQTLNANQSAPIILRIADTSTVTVWTQVSEADIINVKPGQPVYFTILGSSHQWNGTIRQILPTPELINNVVFYDVLFDIPNPTRELKIQMTAQVFIVLAQAKHVLLIPVAAVGNAGAGATVTVKVLQANGRVVPRTITLGIINNISAQVTHGLQAKDKVVTGISKAKKSSSKSALSGQKGL